MFKSRWRTLALIGIAGIIALFFVYQHYIAGGTVPHPGKSYIVDIPRGSSFEDVVRILNEQGILKQESGFRRIAELLKYKKEEMRSGRYTVKGGWDMIKLVRHLRGGIQTPVNVVLNNERLTEDVAGKVARFIEPDSQALLAVFQNEAFIRELGYNPDDLMTLFIPNTYQFFWNTTPEGFMERMVKEHESFWGKDGRRDKAEQLGLSEKEVYTLASIVEKETIRNQEKARIAGTYLNRLRIGQPLQADPTAVFATRDFETKRVTAYHIKFDSPYNTYMYPGLPPGPIAMASIPSIDAVLNAEKHNYFFFCAVGDESGLHSFAETYDQHLQNVRIFNQNLIKRGLR